MAGSCDSGTGHFIYTVRLFHLCKYQGACRLYGHLAALGSTKTGGLKVAVAGYHSPVALGNLYLARFV